MHMLINNSGHNHLISLLFIAYLLASVVHHGLHMVWKHTRVPSLSKMTSFGLKNDCSNRDSLADGDEFEAL